MPGQFVQMWKLKLETISGVLNTSLRETRMEQDATLTTAMREDGGFEVIKKVILNLSLRHTEHNSAYGEGNERRLGRKHDSVSINQFSWGVANRDCSIRGARDTKKAGKGYLEDKRPTSNMHPYIVTGLLAETTVLWEPTLEAEALATQKLALNV
ncbi:putative glutamine synthetase [Helianthus anomalus]